MEKTLAFDLGSNSIGWTLRDASFEKDQFKKSGVITFNAGVGKEKNVEYSFAAQRTSKRSIRRLYQARKYKLWAVLEALRNADYCPISEEELNQWRWYKKNQGYFRKYPVEAQKFNEWVKMDFDGDGKPDYSSPYQLREAIATKKLDLTHSINRYKIGRALYHIAQHRAFKSSKKVNLQEEMDAESIEIGAERKKHKDLEKKLGELGLSLSDKTIGQLFAEAERLFKKQKEGRIRNNLHPHVTRKDLQEEVIKILKTQGLELSALFRDKKGNPVKIHQTPIFWQRPLRSQKGSIGKCTLEPSKFRCPVSHPAFEEFRAWSFLNNIKYKTKGDKEAQWQQLDLSIRRKLYKGLFIGRLKTNFDFFEIYNWLKKENGHDQWDLNYNFKTNVAGCPISARLYKIFGDTWTELHIPHAPNERRKKKKDHYDIEDVWHIPFASDDEEFVRDFATEKLKLDETQTKSYMAMWGSMPVDYAQLSLKAIRNINRFLRKGLIYTEAALLAKLPDIIGENLWTQHEKGMIDHISDVIAHNRKTKKQLGIVNNLIAKYKALPNQYQFAKHNFEYRLEPSDCAAIENECKEVYGEQTWDALEDRDELRSFVENEYQNFFRDEKRQFKKMPHLQDSLKTFLAKRLKLEEPQLRKLYHPSQVEIYPPAKSHYYKELGKELTLLGSPKTGAFKNPMAMRALHELRKLINYLLQTDQIDEQTRIVVEVARELNDSNRRWAIEKYQNMREAENKEFAAAIHELIKDPDAIGVVVNADNADDIDKFRLWYEMMEGDNAKVGYEKEKKFTENRTEIKTRKNKGKEEEYEIFVENNYEKINKQLYFKLKSAGDDVVKKYRLWKEQNCQCLYTGELISLTQLFQPNAVDFEHTIPRSKCFDNSLENLTVCKAEYNRKIKKNHIPFELPNYNESAAGFSAIKPRLKPWENKVEHLKLHLEFWKNKSKRASTKEDKDFAIRQKHLWQFELDYWRGKLERFQMDEIKKGFRNSQLVDTQIISKYASHYLKTVFNKVEIQKGSVTAEFRKILSVQPLDEHKDRSKHSHHAKDAIVLSVIPTSALRDEILKSWYTLDEKKKLVKDSQGDERDEILSDIEFHERRLNELIAQCRFSNVNKAIERLDQEILINNIARDQTLSPARKKLRARGKVIGIKDENGKPIYITDVQGNPLQYHNQGKPAYKRDHNGEWILENGQMIPVLVPKEKLAQGDIIRGQLFLDTFYGKIRPALWDENGSPIKDENGDFIYAEKNDGFRFVLRKEVNKDLNIDSIVDPILKQRIKNQLNGRTIDKTLKEDGGLWMTDKHGNRINKIRHIRCFEDSVTNPLSIKRQSHLSKKDYKNDYWAKSGENYVCAIFQSEKLDKKGSVIVKNNKKVLIREFAIYNLAEIAEKRKSDHISNDDLGIYRKDKNGLDIIQEDGSKEPPYAILKKGTKVIFYENDLEELKIIAESHPDVLSQRVYKVKKFADSRITFDYHLEARDDNELTEAFPKETVYKYDEKGNPITYGKRGKNGFTENFFDFIALNQGKPWHRLLYSKDYFDFAIEGKHFEMLPDNEIKWLF